MFGVVLWSDIEDKKAVIWCEDHGDLAFYTKTHDTRAQDFSLDAGDLVQFDLTMDRHLRFAHNPRLISEGACPELVETLGPSQDAQHLRPVTADIVPFSPRNRSAVVCASLETDEASGF